MKVSISNLNKPAPIGAGVAGGLIGAGGAVLGGVVDAIAGAIQGKKQRQHDKDMAALNNQYQVEQWERENEYNDPTAVRQRYEAAGISPQAAFGQGSASGAGIAGGLSSAPGSTSNAMPAPTDFGGIMSRAGANITTAMSVDKQAEAIDAENQYKSELARGEKFKTDILNPSIAELNTSMSKLNIEKSKSLEIENAYKDKLLKLEVAYKRGSITMFTVEANKALVEMSKLISDMSVNEATKSEIKARIKKIGSDMVRNAYLNALDSAKTKFVNAQTDSEKARKTNINVDTMLKSKDIKYKSKLIDYVQQQCNKLGTDIRLEEAQIKKITSDIVREWEHLEKWKSLETSKEVREWIFGFFDTLIESGKALAGADN